MTRGDVRHAAAVVAFFSVVFILFFSPVLFTARLLPSDGLHASFHSPPELWTNLTWAGYPAAAEPQWESWYPLSRIFHLLPHGFNAFVVTAYVLSASFAYGYVVTLTGSRLAATISGLGFAMSGFMMAHLGHTALIQSALWLPLVMWSLETLRRRWSAGWFAVAVVSVACSLLAGYPQVTLYTMLLGAAYALCLGRIPPGGRLRSLAIYAAVGVLGVAMAAVQLVPTAELVDASVRARLSLEDFLSHSLPLAQLPELLFPYLFGGAPKSPYGLPYFGEFGLPELAGYLGLTTLMLAVIGAWACRRDPIAVFWSVTAVVALLLTLGDATPLGRLLYHVPAVNKFRAPARHFLEVTLAVSVLAGLGVHAVRTGSGGVLRRVVAGAAVLMATSAALIYMAYDRLRTYAAAKQVALPSFGANLAVLVPLVLFLASTLVLLWWSRCHRSRARGALLIGVAVVDVASFGWLYEWPYESPSTDVLRPPQVVEELRRGLDDGRQRVLQLEWAGGGAEMFRLYDVPTVNGYGPLILRRFAALSGATRNGLVEPYALLPGNRALDLLGVRYILQAPPLTTRAHGIDWSESDMNLDLGVGCGRNGPLDAEVRLGKPVHATEAVIVSTMGCSTSILDDAEVLKLAFVGDDGAVDEAALRAGRDTSEWAWDCPAVSPSAAHRRAAIFASSTVSHPRGRCQAHSYLARLPLPGKRYTRITLRWSGRPGTVTVAKISLVDGRTGDSHAVNPLDGLLAGRRRFEVGEVTVYDNAEAMPRAWLVPEVISAPAPRILQTIRTSVLPDGGRFDPRRVALVEGRFSLEPDGPDPDAAADVVRLSNTGIEIRTRTRRAQFLVMGDIYYPGWRASIDGVEVPIHRTNYALRGVLVPPGEHSVRLDFRPLSFYLGGVLTGLAAVTVAAVVVRDRRRRRAAAVSGSTAGASTGSPSP